MTNRRLDLSVTLRQEIIIYIYINLKILTCVDRTSENGVGITLTLIREL